MPDRTVAPTDLTFFTNDESGVSLHERFRRTLTEVQFFDVLVGYFRISGFHQLYEALEDVEHIRILVGLNVGRTTHRLLQEHRGESSFGFESHAKAHERVRGNIVEQMEAAEEARDVEKGLRAFLRFLEEGKMEVRAFPTENIHAKAYIGRYDSDAHYGHVITGSSNFTESGLRGQREFNVELKDRADVEFALEKFEELWEQSVEVTEDFVETLRHDTWLNDEITPYDLYLKFLYEYFEEDINLDQRETDELYRPDDFLELEYQEQAVTAARKILDAHDGVFIADVVGLGKTYVTAMLMQQLQGRTLVVCPPVLEDYWRETFVDFGVRGYRIESLGKLDHVLRDGHEKYDFVVLDEAHRFRNETTQRYEKLHQIAFGKKVICVSATPLNNDVSDIYSLLKLFQTPRRSTIPGVRDLKRFFDERQRRLNRHERGTPAYTEVAQNIYDEVRDRVLKHVMIRRTRSEVEQYYGDDMEKQGLSFPDVAAPRRILYEFDESLDTVFTRTIDRIGEFSYARYTPLLFYEGEIDPLREQSQRNIGGFMKSILVKRLESSFYAFKRTLARFIESYERFIEMYRNGTVYLGRDVNVFDLLDNDREERLHELLEEGRVSKYDADDFSDELMDELRADLRLLREIQRNWAPIDEDPKLDAFLDRLQSDDTLRDGKLLIFTEAAETGRYLLDALEEAVPGKAIFYSSDGGRDGDGSISVQQARRRIKNTFDPTVDDPEDEYRILITTDVLAEGINLHRSNTVMNYDLPWNPTRVLQRVGRVNRVGGTHDQIFVYNFFPTAAADEEINLEANITSKIQAFHDTLGEDAQYLTDEEEVTTHGLFGEELYERLNDADTYDGEPDEGPSELKYLRLLRDLRDNDSEQFERIKNLPKKARTARSVDEGPRHPSGLLTFFRRGDLKQFFLAEEEVSRELTFFEAAQAFECEPGTSRIELPEDFYDRLARNKEAFDHSASEETDGSSAAGGLSNEEYVMKRLRTKEMKHCKRFTDRDDQFRQEVLRAFDDAVIPEKTIRRIKHELESEADPLKALQIFREYVPDSILDVQRRRRDERDEHREVILSGYLQSD
ncbi:SNF2-related protein [Salinibacter sp.]|uniref:SNF2-related protein n=1 Tax=Salinibacter sp. TaxID=2065818 RepID=UPI0021E81E48|nr:SNF2-related protein [Salinibacter sp.]